MHEGLDQLLDICPPVRDALEQGLGVVALESTAIAHGLPWPRSAETAYAMHDAIGEAGAVPAMIAIRGGRIRVGLDTDEIEQLARARTMVKASRRDLAALLALGRGGATTVAGTMACAALAGIDVFATGGIGGVHRGVEHTHDISADLTELGRTPVAVVCSGAKSILDLPRTLEALETEGVPVIGYRTDRFPAFHCRDSGLPVDTRVDSPDDAARIISAQRALDSGGVLFANPVPEADALDRIEVEGWVEAALREANNTGVRGKDITPFLLDRINVLSGGRTLDSNIALLQHNAAVAGRIAAALATL